MDSFDTTPRTRTRLDLLYRLSQTFNSSLDLYEVLNRVMDEVIASVKAERGFVMLINPDGSLRFTVARGIDHQIINDPEFQVSRSIVERVAREVKPVLTSDAQSDKRFSMRQSVMLLGLRSILCVPLVLKERALGVIYVDNRLQSGIFSPSDLELVTAISSNAAIAIENARLYQLAVEKGRLEQELQMARQVQINLLPEETPQIAGWEFSASWRPARQVSGDYYDFIHLPDRQIGVVVGDVSDKGMPAALFMAMSRTTIRASMNIASSPTEGIQNANRLICSDTANGMFITLFYAQINPQSGEITYVNAGHNPPLFCHNQAGRTGQLARLERTGIALGVLENAEYKQNTIRLSPGDFIMLYTDGVTDAKNSSGHHYGMERMESLLMNKPDLTADHGISSLIQSIEEFSGESESYDDITLTMVRRLPE